jgi:hypothetical protein
MTIRKIASTVFAAVIASASLAAVASAATTTPPMHHRHSMMHHSMKGSMGMHHDAGSAATDALNEQSLSSARSGTAPAMGMPGGAAPAMGMPSGTAPAGTAQ